MCGSALSDVQGVEQAVRGRLGWDVVPVVGSDAAALALARTSARRCFVVVGDVDRAVERLVGERAPNIPLLILGGAARPELSPACWLPAVPTATMIATLLAQLVGAAPSTRSWRRKADTIIGQSPAVRELLATLDRVAPAEAAVLITGESGTGKELVARALHYSGPRADAPFVAINCAAIPESLFESELFGHTRGAFTGAVASRPGVFEAAHGGTLFLDELGEMPLSMQPKLLRVIETGQVTRLGSNDARQINFRLVTATNRRLDDEVEAGRFREDLFYRVRVFSLNIPPLRDRPEDVAPLVSHHLAQLASRDRRPTPVISKGALEKLLRHRWPGNVRELVNVLERAMVMAPAGGPIDELHVLLPEDATPMLQTYRDARDRFEAQYYGQLLRTAGGNVSLVAKLAKRTRTQVYEALRRLAIDPSQYRAFDEVERS
ncbi:MAG: Response regulator of zinc sigma-54-dependent two-component system [Myxococcales bacterium]|nr:Response regulator of zinc sigma-54-dependent two-component system [Myxococcales bacterium]